MRRLYSFLLFVTLLLLSVPARGAVTVNEHDVDTLVTYLDRLLANRNEYIAERRARIKQLTLAAEKERTAAALVDVADAYVGFATDRAIINLREAMKLTPPGSGERNVLRARLAVLYPMVGLVNEAQASLDSVDTSDMTPQERMDYQAAAMQSYFNMSLLYHNFPGLRMRCKARETEFRTTLLRDTPGELRDEAVYRLALGDSFMDEGQLDKAETLLNDVIDTEPVGSILRSRAAVLLSQVMWKRHERLAHSYYLMKAACNDLLAGDTDASSLFNVAEMMRSNGDMTLATKYFRAAIDYSLDNHNLLTLLESGRYAPLVTQSYEDAMRKARHWAVAIAVLAALLIVAVVVLVVKLRKRNALLRQNQNAMQQLHATRNEYLSRFMDLCAIYVTRLTQFTTTVESKIRAGKTDELLRLVRSGKAGPDQSADFFRVFDTAFLHIYPDFVNRVNELMQDGQKLEPDAPDALSTDLRILAFMRLGMRDSSQIAQMMGYSVNTLYAYRTRLRNQAISKDTFEDDIHSIPLG